MFLFDMPEVLHGDLMQDSTRRYQGTGGLQNERTSMHL